MSELTFTPETAANYENLLRGTGITMTPEQTLGNVAVQPSAPAPK